MSQRDEIGTKFLLLEAKFPGKGLTFQAIEMPGEKRNADLGKFLGKELTFKVIAANGRKGIWYEGKFLGKGLTFKGRCRV